MTGANCPVCLSASGTSGTPVRGLIGSTENCRTISPVCKSEEITMSLKLLGGALVNATKWFGNTIVEIFVFHN